MDPSYGLIIRCTSGHLGLVWWVDRTTCVCLEILDPDTGELKTRAGQQLIVIEDNDVFSPPGGCYVHKHYTKVV